MSPPLSISSVPPPVVTVVTPVFNEEAVLPELFGRLGAVFDANPGVAWRAVLVDDGSRDRTVELIRAHAARDGRFELVELSRNFGFQSALTAGLVHADASAAVVTMDADLQDPPEVIPEMVAAWRSGVDVAYGRRRSRAGETRFKLLTASLFHRLFASLIPYPMPVDTGDFKLIDRAVADAVNALPERRRYLRSLVPWVGFRHEPVWYDRHARVAGTTKYSPWKLLKLAGDALVLSSDAPLRLTWVAAGGLALLGVVAAGWATVSAATSATPQSGVSLAAVTAVIGCVAAVQTAAVSIVGEYVVRGYREAQGRPTSVVRRTISAAAAGRSASGTKAA